MRFTHIAGGGGGAVCKDDLSVNQVKAFTWDKVLNTGGTTCWCEVAPSYLGSWQELGSCQDSTDFCRNNGKNNRKRLGMPAKCFYATSSCV